MPTFEITIKEVHEYAFTIDSENKESAIDKAYELMESKEEKDKHFFDSDALLESVHEV